MNELKDSVLERIEKEHIQPRPRWQFIVKEYGVWFLLGAFIGVGALAISIVLYAVTDNDWDIYGMLGRTQFEHVLLSLPLVWLLVGSLMLAVALRVFRTTKRGYRRRVLHIALAVVLASACLGVAAYAAGLGRAVESVLYERVPFYEGHMSRMMGMWSVPERGLVAGEIIGIASGTSFTLRDLYGSEWEVYDEGAFWMPGAAREVGSRVKIVGSSTIDDVSGTITVRAVRPWAGPVLRRGDGWSGHGPGMMMRGRFPISPEESEPVTEGTDERNTTTAP